MKGKGYVEFLACKEEIIQLLDSGYTKMYVYNMLSSQGKLTTTCWNFYRILKKLKIKKRKLETLKVGVEQVEDEVRKDFVRNDTHEKQHHLISDEKMSEDSSVILNNDPDEQDRHW